MTKAECYTPELFAKQIITQGCNLCFLFWQSSLIVTGEDVNNLLLLLSYTCPHILDVRGCFKTDLKA